ncbi:uncharacterized protein LOC111611191 isoform X2 [Xiphophorus maculatus]|uniref:uncharacterized protein LOC111611191 isoform X2 n=1 Tax=Xiphophorus maculatus TaxID=8083 RepID=UPI000C6D17AC|nr:uncharacterized protein LOC111611191 isoform X2 [Xiphophorus maculatus]XP_023202783.1 uncharacterized protein LOC111611191 isoform X2 [Xiphophorus maculatus]
MKMISRILLLLILSSCLCATFVVNVTQSCYQAQENHSITLEWTFTTKTQGSWRDLFIYCRLVAPHKELIFYQVHGGVEIPDSQDEQFSGRVQIDKDVLREGRIRLHVSRLRTEDSGQYLCDVKTEDGSDKEKCQLNVSKMISAVPGQSVSLPCRLPNIKPAVVVQWTRPDLEPEYVLLFRDEQPDPENQHPSFRKRVELQERRMKDGDVSLLLSNVTTSDSGKYECRVFQRVSSGRKTVNLTSDPIWIVFLDVAPPPENVVGRKEDGSRNNHVGLIVGAILIIGAVLIAALIIGLILHHYVIKTKEEETEDEQITELTVSVKDGSSSDPQP